MPRGDGTGPFGTGPMTGRRLGMASESVTNERRYGMGCGQHHGCGQNHGRGYGRGLGRCYNIDEVAPRTDRELLLKQKEMLNEEIELINRELENL